jgi:hypothetical protein
MALKLKGSTSGFTAIDAPAVAGDNTLVLPGGNGTSGQYLQTDGSGGLSWQTVTIPASAVYTSGTTQDLNTETSVIVTGIPTNAVRVFVTLQDVSWANNPTLQFRLGTSDGIVTTNYVSTGNSIYSSGALVGGNVTTAFQLGGATSSSHIWSGHIEISLVDTNDYVLTSNLHNPNTSYTSWVGGRVQLGGVLDRFEMTLSSSNFDSGQFRVDYLTQS